MEDSLTNKKSDDMIIVFLFFLTLKNRIVKMNLTRRKEEGFSLTTSAFVNSGL